MVIEYVEFDACLVRESHGWRLFRSDEAWPHTKVLSFDVLLRSENTLSVKFYGLRFEIYLHKIYLNDISR